MTRRFDGGFAAITLVLLVSMGLGTACLGRSPDVRHFMLGETAGAEPSSGGESEMAVLVGPVRLPAYLERSQLARLEDGGEIRLDEFSRWLGGFEANFIRALSLGIARELGSVKVVGYPSEAPFAMDYSVRLHVDDMIFEGRDELRVRIRWALIPGSGSSPPRLFVMDERIPVRGTKASDLVMAHEAALSELARRIVREIDSGSSGDEPVQQVD